MYPALLLHSIAISEVWSRWSELPESVREDLVKKPELRRELNAQFAEDLINLEAENVTSGRDALLEYLAARLCMAVNDPQVPGSKGMAAEDREVRLMKILRQLEEVSGYDKTWYKCESTMAELTEKGCEATISPRVKNLQNREWLTYW